MQEFFEDVNSHQQVLTALRHQVDSSTQQHFQPTFTRLSGVAHAVADRAAVHGAKLERAQRQWLEFESQFNDAKSLLRRWRLMTPSSSDLDSVAQLRRELWQVHELERSMHDESSNVLHALDLGAHLLQSVKCDALERDVKQCSDEWCGMSGDTSALASRCVHCSSCHKIKLMSIKFQVLLNIVCFLGSRNWQTTWRNSSVTRASCRRGWRQRRHVRSD